MDVIRRSVPAKEYSGGENEKSEKRDLKRVDPKKLVLYSEIMKPKFDD